MYLIEPKLPLASTFNSLVGMHLNTNGEGPRVEEVVTADFGLDGIVGRGLQDCVFLCIIRHSNFYKKRFKALVL